MTDREQAFYVVRPDGRKIVMTLDSVFGENDEETEHCIGDLKEAFAEGATFAILDAEEAFKSYGICPSVYHDRLKHDGWQSGKLRPSIFMPRWASRITLEITDIRVERLHEITEEDALAEGITKTNLGFSYCENSYYASAKEAYESLWKSINGVQSWLDNPWVWVITFKVAEIKQ